LNKKKIFYLCFFCLILVASNVNGLYIPSNNITQFLTICPPNDSEDQYQKINDYLLFNISENQILAQSFIPTKKYLSRVKLRLYQGNYISNTDLIVSIRQEIDGRDITSIKIKSEDIESSDNFSSYWIEFDFSDISVIIGDEYFIIARIAYNDLFYGYSWASCMNSDDLDHYVNGSMWINNLDLDLGWVKDISDTCFITYGYNDNFTISDLDCEGSLIWEDIEPRKMITGNFYIKNIGDLHSLLDWEIYEYPNWGEWTFTPIEGYDLNGGEQTNVKVSIVIPDEEESYFSGLIKIVNKNYSEDRDIVKVTITTQKIKNIYYNNFRIFKILLF
jgi:hypothetical protein